MNHFKKPSLVIQSYNKWSVILRNVHLPTNMKCLCINNYSKSVDQLEFKTLTECPSERDLKPDDALVKISAASVNPFDIEMISGYGRNAMNVFRKIAKENEFPLILGRDCSGVIVKRGKRFRRFQVGDPVCCVRWIVGQGTHAEYVIVNKNEISAKPEGLNYIEAASLPYVACTTWNALVNSNVVPTTGRPKRIFIPGGTGGIGSFATQLCQALGHDVITTCASDGVAILETLGVTNVIDYTSATYTVDLENAGPFDIIFDTLNETYFDFFQKLLKPNSLSSYVSLRPTLLPDMDQQGVLLGALKAGTNFVKSNVSQLASGRGSYHWGFFSPNASVLDKVKPFIKSRQIKPLVDKVFTIDEIVDAYKYVESGHARGKTVIQMDS